MEKVKQFCLMRHYLIVQFKEIVLLHELNSVFILQ